MCFILGRTVSGEKYIPKLLCMCQSSSHSIFLYIFGPQCYVMQGHAVEIDFFSLLSICMPTCVVCSSVELETILSRWGQGAQILWLHIPDDELLKEGLLVAWWAARCWCCASSTRGKAGETGPTCHLLLGRCAKVERPEASREHSPVLSAGSKPCLVKTNKKETIKIKVWTDVTKQTLDCYLLGYGVGPRSKRSSVWIRPWPLRWVLGQGSLLPLSQGEAFTLASISYLVILVK